MKTARIQSVSSEKNIDRLPETPAAVTRANRTIDFSFVIDLAIEIKQTLNHGKAHQNIGA